MSTANPVKKDLAQTQWRNIYDLYTKTIGWEVSLIEPVMGLPDMIFTANGALVIDGKVALPTFREPDRQPETPLFRKWFEENEFTDFLQPKYDFEGEGDALVWNDIVFAGYPWRSDSASHQELAKFFGKQIVGLQLADSRFYHLDTCLSIVSKDTVAVWPKAFTSESLVKIRKLVPNVVEADDKDALSYGLNAMSDGENIVISDGAKGLIKKYKTKGMSVYPTPISEFQKSGGGVKCLTLELRY